MAIYHLPVTSGLHHLRPSWGSCIIVGLVTYPTVLRRSCSHARRKDSSASSCHESRPQGKGLTYFIPSGKRLHFAIENDHLWLIYLVKDGEFP